MKTSFVKTEECQEYIKEVCISMLKLLSDSYQTNASKLNINDMEWSNLSVNILASLSYNLFKFIEDASEGNVKCNFLLHHLKEALEEIQDGKSVNKVVVNH
jgi:hypothetical protein